MICDVSGFVQISNLHHRTHGPKVGAEKTRLWLDSVFEVLLQGVEEFQGEVVQFIGDAIVAIFPKEMAKQALQCSLHIKARCNRIQVHVKTGLSAGAFDLYQSNEQSSKPLATVLGPPVQSSLLALQKAGQSDVVCDKEFLQLCDPPALSYTANPIEDGFFKLITQADLESRSLFQLLASDVQHTELNEIKLLTILYAEVFVSSDKAQNPHWLSELCIHLSLIESAHSATLSGLCQTIHGYRFQYILGSSKSELNDVELAMQMATQIQEAIDLHLGMVVPNSTYAAHRISIGYGNAWQGKYGGQRFKLFNAHGREVNLAARILDKAELGQIYLTQGAAQQLGEQIHVVDQGEIPIKGEEGPIRIFRIPLRHEIAPDTLHKGKALYGRTREFEEALAQEGGLIQITGAAGIGKSTFVAGVERTLREQNRPVFTLRSSPYSKLVPYSIAHRLLTEIRALYLQQTNQSESLERWLLESLHQHEGLSEWIGVISLITPLKVSNLNQAHEASPDVKNQAIIRIFKALVNQATRDFRPHIIVEDLQWFDNASLQLVTEVLFQAPDCSCIYTIRTSDESFKTNQLLERLEKSHPSIKRIHLMPFSLAETEQFLLNRFSAATVPSPLVNALHKLSEGNLLLISALIQGLLQNRTIHHTVAGGVQVDFRKLEEFSALPTNMEHALQARIDTLPKTHRLTLTHCSIFKTAFSPKEVQSAFEYRDADWVEQTFATLEQEKFIRSFTSTSGETLYTFEHQVIEQCVYDRIPFEERKGLHAKFAEWLEGQMTYPQTSDASKLTIRLAAQYDWAGMLLKALPLAKEAIRFAFEVGALEEASERVDKLIEWHKKGLLPDSLPLDLAQLYERKAHIYYSQGQFQEATEQYHNVLETLGLYLNSNTRWLERRNLLLLHSIYLKKFFPQWAGKKRSKPTPESNLIIRVCTALGELGFFRGMTDVGNLYLLKAVQIAEQYEFATGDQAKAYAGCVILSQIYRKRKWFDYFKTRLHDQIQTLPPGQEQLKANAHIGHRIGYTEYAQAHFKIAYEMIEQSVTSSKLSHEYQTELLAHSLSILIRVAEGRFDEAIAGIDSYEVSAKKYAVKYFNVFHQYGLINQRVYCLAMKGRLREARTHLHFLEKIAKEFNYPKPMLVPIERCKLMVLYRERDWAAARSQAFNLASLLSEEILNKAYYYTCYSLPIEVLLEASQHHNPLLKDEQRLIKQLFKHLDLAQSMFKLARPIYLILQARWVVQENGNRRKARHQLNEAFNLARLNGQLVEIEMAERFLDTLS